MNMQSVKKKILVVDDQDEVLFFIKEGLKSFLDLEADTVQSGEEALRAIESNDYALVITDENMPGMNGSTLAKIIKTEIAPHMPVLLLSGEVLEDHRTMTTNFDDLYVMLKPVRMESFFNEISVLLNGTPKLNVL